MGEDGAAEASLLSFFCAVCPALLDGSMESTRSRHSRRSLSVSTASLNQSQIFWLCGKSRAACINKLRAVVLSPACRAATPCFTRSLAFAVIYATPAGYSRILCKVYYRVKMNAKRDKFAVLGGNIIRKEPDRSAQMLVAHKLLRKNYPPRQLRTGRYGFPDRSRAMLAVRPLRG